LLSWSQSDCPDALWINTAESTHIIPASSVGEETGLANAPCRTAGLTETHPAWLQFQTSSPGQLAFTLQPDEPTDDLDFVLYRLPGGAADCISKIPLRCMAAGPRYGAAATSSANCIGNTGLRSDAAAEQSTTGCQPGAGNFLAALPVQPGATYALWANNYTAARGFTITFTGDVLLAEKPFTFSELPIKAYPNPSDGDFQLEFLMPKAGQATIYAYSPQGQQVYHQPLELQAGQQEITVPAANWAAGLYWLGVVVDGERSGVKVEKL